MAKIADLKAWLVNPAAGPLVYKRPWDQKCQAFVYQMSLKFGVARSTYLTAVAARKASGALNLTSAAAPPGAYHYWDIGTAGHVAISLGNGYVAMASKHIQDRWATDVGVTTVAKYSAATGAKYRGWSMKNGVNSISISDTYGNPPVTASQRVVLASAPVNRRADATTQSARKEPQLAPGELGNFLGWKYGESVNGNNVWFKGISGDWFHSGGFVGGANTAGLADLNPVVETLKPTQRKAKDAEANRRLDPSTKQAAIEPPLAANEVGNFIAFAHGESVLGNDIWFQGISKHWFWSGGFTDVGTHDLPEVVFPTAPPVVTPPVDEPDPQPEPEPQPPYTLTTFGIDVATSQAGLDFAAAAAGDVDFVIVKAGGNQIAGGPYTSPQYVAQVDAAAKTGVKLGHYWLVGKTSGLSAIDQAKHFLSILHDFDVTQDVLALDNEFFKESSNSELWTDSKVAQFFQTIIVETGIDPRRLWLYMGASDYRAGRPWTLTRNIGVRLWVASYGANSTERTPLAVPDVGGDEWTVHQFSSKQTVAGKTVDGNWSRLPLPDLFPVGKPTTPPVTEPDPIDQGGVNEVLDAMETFLEATIVSAQARLDAIKAFRSLLK